jgi:benzil reductase ((S)-benzoin forming)
LDRISIVTGGGSGIGRAICHALAKNNHHVLIVGRREEKLKETQKAFPTKIDILLADISEIDHRLKIAEYCAGKKIQFLVHNAGIIGKITNLEELELSEWRKVMAINVEAPLFLTQILLPNLHDGRILNISSGAAHFAIKGWGAYCISKAALFMIYQVMNVELAEKNIKIASLRPGIVDTEMQGFIREVDIKKMPHLQKFHDLYNEKGMESSDRVARFAYWVLTETDDDEFSEKEWDIREGDHSAKWDKDKI